MVHHTTNVIMVNIKSFKLLLIFSLSVEEGDTPSSYRISTVGNLKEALVLDHRNIHFIIKMEGGLLFYFSSKSIT